MPDRTHEPQGSKGSIPNMNDNTSQMRPGDIITISGVREGGRFRRLLEWLRLVKPAPFKRFVVGLK